MTKFISFAMLSLSLVACAVEDPTDGEDLAVPDEAEAGEIAIPAELQLAEAGDTEEGVEGTPYASQSYCVDQSYASARGGVTCDWFIPSCSIDRWTTQLSRNHRVRILPGMCTGTYVHVYSLWNNACYLMRRDALRPC